MSKEVTLQLSPEEEVVAIIRRSSRSHLPRVCMMVAWILVPFFFFFPLLSFGGIGLLVFVGLAASGIVYALREWHMWYHTMWVITDHRVIDIDQMGWVGREMHEIPIKQIKKVHLRYGSFVARILGYATLWIETTSSHAFDIELDGVRRPKQIKTLLRDLHKTARLS